MSNQVKQPLSTKQISDIAFEKSIYAVDLLIKGLTKMQSIDDLSEQRRKIGIEALNTAIKVIRFVQNEEPTDA